MILRNFTQYIERIIVYHRRQVEKLTERLVQGENRIQILSGPRQTGKTTIATQVMENLRMQEISCVFASADSAIPHEAAWIREKWVEARLREAESGRATLFLDEVQKVRGWAEQAKLLWDEDRRHGRKLGVVLLGSSRLLMMRGTSESLVGRFEVIPVFHWSYPEMHEAFGIDMETYIIQGGYPGSVDLMEDFARWRAYILDAIVEPVLTRDLLLSFRVDKPALLRNLFVLGCRYASQVLSYNRMVGQLQDAGNTTTLAHYLELLEEAGLMAGLQKFSGSEVRTRSSSPKLLPLNNALVTAVVGLSPDDVARDPAWRGRLVENAVGCTFYEQLVNRRKGRLEYWRQGGVELDFVLRIEKSGLGIEVTSGLGHGRKGIEAFSDRYPGIPAIMIGGDGLPLKGALKQDAEQLIRLSRS